MTDYLNKLRNFLEIEKEVIKGCNEVYKELGIDIWEVFCRKYVKKGGCCDTCENARFVAEYPEFTPAKQLELIKLITKKHQNIGFLHSSNFYAIQVNPVARAFGMYYEAEKFEELIAIITLELLKVGELDKTEVKKILEDD